ncbi:AmpG family muropeptide MFS transporter [bacterium]|nr:AmpG family muropeptide MFS transporter [bacterium]
MSPAHPQSLRESLAAFADARIAVVFLLGIASGLPWVLIGSVLSAWLVDAGISRTTIGALGAIGGIYALNFLWAPLLDRLHVPGLRKLGRRRGWIVLMQFLLLGLTALMVTQDPNDDLFGLGMVLLGIALCGATMDIAIDAYRIDVIPRTEQGAISHGAAAASAGWWTGYSLCGALAFFVAGGTDWGWDQIYGLMALIWLPLMLVAMFAPEPPNHSVAAANPARNPLEWVVATYWPPFRDFFTRHGVKLGLGILLFLLTFKLGEAFLGRMSIVFYKQVGYTDTQIGAFSKTFGWVITIVFSVVASVFNARFGLVRGLIVAGIAMASTNLLFSVIAIVGPESWLFAVTVLLDNFTAAYSTVAFVAFVSFLTSHAFSATQYALMASIGNLGRTLLASPSGAIVDYMDGNWALFFLITSLMVVPSLLLLIWIAKALRAHLANDAAVAQLKL